MLETAGCRSPTNELAFSEINESGGGLEASASCQVRQELYGWGWLEDAAALHLLWAASHSHLDSHQCCLSQGPQKNQPLSETCPPHFRVSVKWPSSGSLRRRSQVRLRWLQPPQSAFLILLRRGPFPPLSMRWPQRRPQRLRRGRWRKPESQQTGLCYRSSE